MNISRRKQRAGGIRPRSSRRRRHRWPGFAAAFSWFGVPSALSLGTLAGVLELIPVIGPLTVMVMAAGQADQYQGHRRISHRLSGCRTT
jgi:hypothetical protein